MSYYNQQQPPTNPGYQGPGFQPQGANPYQPGWNVGSPQGQHPNQSEPQYGHSPHYAEGGVPKNEMGFSDVTIRANFVRKVFIMVTVMLGMISIPWRQYMAGGIVLFRCCRPDVCHPLHPPADDAICPYTRRPGSVLPGLVSRTE